MHCYLDDEAERYLAVIGGGSLVWGDLARKPIGKDKYRETVISGRLFETKRGPGIQAMPRLMLLNWHRGSQISDLARRVKVPIQPLGPSIGKPM